MQVFACGLNNYGQLGVGDRENRTEPTLVPKLSNIGVVSIEAGEHHTVAMTSIGTGEEQDENAPVEVSSRSKHLKGRQVMQVGAGGQHTVVLVCNAGVALTAIPAAGGGAGAAAGAAADGPATPGTAKKRNRPSGLPLSGRKSARK